METLERLKDGKLIGQNRLSLSCGLTAFPTEILDLADSLEILDLSGNRLKALPEDFGRLQKLKIAFFSFNEFEVFPSVLAECPNLSMVGFKSNQIRTVPAQALAPQIRWLILTDNQIQALPADIGRLHKLQKLMLAGNQLRTLPKELANCQNLELIRLAANQLETLPHALFNLPRLAWLALAGNPCCESIGAIAAQRSQPTLPVVDMAEVELGEILGEGASGVIYQGVWHPKSAASEAQPQVVAVKLFKGQVTSDGLPLDEMRACIGAGSHPNLVKVLGRLENCPEGKAGLVFQFIASEYANLGNPPSLETCTRDTYPPATTFTLPVILRIAQGMAAAGDHLHHNGIMHGDLYAHNILVDAQGNSLLGDFGAAFFYEPTDALPREAFEKLEVRAFGCLLEDLLDRHVATSGAASAEATTVAQLRRLQQNCMTLNPAARPVFSAIHEIVSTGG